MNELVKYLILNFWKITGLVLFFIFALFLVIFGFMKTVFIIVMAVLGYILGKWKDEGISFRQIFKDIFTSMRVPRQ